jgi:predicted O-methyltransferase YrrM
MKEQLRTLKRWVRHPVDSLRQLSARDYCSPGLVDLPRDVEKYFPHASRVTSFNLKVSHVARSDRRHPQIGFATWDEASYLMNVARLFPEGRGLEIGCWMGWSTLCIAMSGIKMDVIDPGLGQSFQGDTVREALRVASLAENVNLVSGTSPDAVHELGRQGVRWSFCFVDGDHDGDAPRKDLEAVVPYCTPDAIIACHDASLDNIYRAIGDLTEQGWKVKYLQTAVGLGVAWRGNVTPPAHEPDPAVNWPRVELYPVAASSSNGDGR